MTISQQITLVDQSSNLYDDEIMVTDVPNKHFIAVINNQLSSDSSTREIIVSIMPLEQNPGGTLSTNSGMFVRTSNETSVKVTLKKDGKVLGENTTNY